MTRKRLTRSTSQVQPNVTDPAGDSIALADRLLNVSFDHQFSLRFDNGGLETD